MLFMTVAQHREIRSRVRLLSHILSHDLREQVRGVDVMLRLAQEERGLQAGELVEQAIAQAAILDRRIVALTRFVRQTDIEEEPPLAPLAEVLAMARTQAPGLMVTVVGDLSPLVPKVLSHAIGNLLSNAEKHGCEKPAAEVVITTKSRGWARKKLINVQVTDNGIGFDPRIATEVFEPFKRFDANSEGTGIGLAIVRQIAEQLGGSVSAHSGGEGQGATFTLEVPCGS